MNIPVLIAGIIAAMATIGHFTVGRKLYLKPLMESDMDLLPKKVMQTVFHYISVYMVLSSWMLIMVGIQGEKCMFDPTLALSFIAYNYLFFGITQIVTALRSKVPGALLKMFQWIFWILIGTLILLGTY